MIYFETSTAVLCALGWLLHWLGTWGEAWKVNKQSFAAYLGDDPPALTFSLVATVALYGLGPTALGALGLELPGDGSGVKLLSALAVGYMADSLVGKLRTLSRSAA